MANRQEKKNSTNSRIWPTAKKKIFPVNSRLSKFKTCINFRRLSSIMSLMAHYPASLMVNPVNK